MNYTLRTFLKISEREINAVRHVYRVAWRTVDTHVAGREEKLWRRVLRMRDSAKTKTGNEKALVMPEVIA